MKKKQRNLLIICCVLLIFGCSRDHELQRMSQSQLSPKFSQSEYQANAGANQIAGVGFYADVSDCDYPGEGADFALHLTGDLEGCLFVFVDSHDCSPSGTYREQGREYFVGSYNGEEGTFWTNYKFEAKFEGCSDGFFLGAEIFGRCQHPIQAGSGTGAFEDVKGRLDFKDDIDNGTFPYRGHLRY